MSRLKRAVVRRDKAAALLESVESEHASLVALPGYMTAILKDIPGKKLLQKSALEWETIDIVHTIHCHLEHRDIAEMSFDKMITKDMSDRWDKVRVQNSTEYKDLLNILGSFV